MSAAVTYKPGDSIPLDYRPVDAAGLAACLADPMWRICSGALYKIMTKAPDEEGGDDATNIVDFRPNRAQRRQLRRLWHRNVILKARQLGFCQDENMRVLTADLKWVRIADLKVGEEIVAVDEHVPGGRGASRKMRTAVVEAKVEVHRKAYRIKFDDGRELVCTGQHPWLSRKAGTEAKWRAIEPREGLQGRLKVGTHVRWITKPWDEPTVEDGWMGGMLDGEGSMAKPSRTGGAIGISQLPGPVMDRAEKYLKDRGYNARKEDDDSARLTKYGKHPVPKLVVSRMDEMFSLIGRTRPTRFLGRRFWEGKDLPGKRTGDGWATITSIEEMPEQKMIDLQTSTGTYIAEGFVSHNTTLVCIMWLDHALFVPNQRCVMVAQDLKKATALFRDKIIFAYDRLPKEVRDACPIKSVTKTELTLANNSVVEITNSARSGTVHRLHISEMGKIGATHPHKAVEIVTGSFPAVPLGSGIIIVESTAEGQAGEFYKIVQKALQNEEKGKKLNERDFRISFYPWHEEAEYVLDQDQRETKEDTEYFAEIEAAIGNPLSRKQRNWYMATRDADFSGDEEKMWQEYPSTVEEAFKVSTEGAYYAKQLMKARKQRRIGFFPHVEGLPVHTFWDIGAGDGTGIWLMQQIGGEHRFIGYIENWGEAYSFYVTELQNLGYMWGTHHLPHDAEHERQQGDTTEAPIASLRKMKLGGTWETVPRVEDINHGIQLTRAFFSKCTFDEVGCKEGLIHLQNYRKEWDENRGTWKLKPRHDIHSEGADSYRQAAQGYKQTSNIKAPARKPANWRTA